MYGLRNLWDKEPVVIAEAVRVVLFTLAMLGVIALGEKELAGIALAVSAFLSLFVRGKVSPV